MKILFLAPQPFFQERGTPIAVRLALEVLAARGRDSIDLLTYHEGVDVEIPGVTIHRIWAPRWLSGIGPGISFKKVLCDFIFLFAALRLVVKARGTPYSLVHAVEESVFIACLIRVLFGIPYIYDMDSSLALQLTEKWTILKPLTPVLRWCEGVAIRMSCAVVPVCDALAVIAGSYGQRPIQVLYDISLLDQGQRVGSAVSLREEASLPGDARVVVYIGNLERYQGIDLLLEGFSFLAARDSSAQLIIIGGSAEHIAHYTSRARALNIGERVHLLGPRPVATLNHYLLQADILVSPRTMGNNTPMKIYSYLHSGRPVVATRLPTHTQVMDDRVSVLTEPTAEAFGTGLLSLVRDASLCAEIGERARLLAEERYTFEIFQRSLNSLYDRLSPPADSERESTPFATEHPL